MRARCRAASHLDVERRLSPRQIVLLQQLFPDFDEAGWRISTGERYSHPLEAPLEPLVVETGREESAVDGAEDFVHAVAKHEPAVLDGHACLPAREEAAVYIDDVFRVHWAR